MVVIWDDHEVQDNYAGGAPGGGAPAASRATRTARRAAGYQAWFESMPTFAGKRDRIYRKLRFGKTLDLFMLDQRRYRADQPCDDAVVAGLRRPRRSRAPSSAPSRCAGSSASSTAPRPRGR